MALAEKSIELIEIDGLKFHSIAEAEIQAQMGFVDRDKLDEFKQENEPKAERAKTFVELFRQIASH